MAEREATAAGPRIHPALVVALILAAAVVDFVVQNTNKVTIHFLWLSKRLSLWVALLVASVVAIVAAELFSMVLRRRRRARD